MTAADDGLGRVFGSTRAHADEEGSSRPGQRGRLDPRLQDLERHRSGAVNGGRGGSFRDQLSIAEEGPSLFPSDLGSCGHHTTFKTTGAATLRRAGVAHFGIYDLRSTYATRLSAGGVADE